MLAAGKHASLRGGRRREFGWRVRPEAGAVMHLVTRARRRGQSGNALIEFALAFGFLFPCLTGTFQFGYAFFIYNELQNAVRQGARYAAFKTYDSSSSTPTT